MVDYTIVQVFPANYYFVVKKVAWMNEQEIVRVYLVEQLWAVMKRPFKK